MSTNSVLKSLKSLAFNLDLVRWKSASNALKNLK